MKDQIKECLRLKGYSGAALHEETNRVDRAVSGTIYSREIFKYKCGRCGLEHWTKEGEPEVCKEEFHV